ncbi:MAG: hypothetical protein GX764_07635, partial [Firmicutes bacterium]|nr:hypothetical protein [Bacillota bacterium]
MNVNFNLKKKSFVGPIRYDLSTKKLVKRLQPQDIALISHNDLDEIAADSLLRTKVKIVLNTGFFCTESYVNNGPGKLLDRGITLVEGLGEKFLLKLKEGDPVEVKGESIFKNGKKIAKGQILTKELLSKKIARAEINQGKLLDRFVQNTLEYARREKGIILGSLTMPKLQTVIRDRHVLVVVRGKNYREDLKAIMHYIDEVKPVLIGVDGGADALWEFGYRADIVIGDMDSVGDEALQNAAELVVHAYPDGRAPGMERVKKLGLEAKIFSAPGTSEDVAMLLAYENKAELIVALGTHSSMVDFLEKGRAGMASTFLVRLKVGEKLVDARGVSQLYRKTANYRFVAPLLIAALLPIAVLAALSPWVQ